MNEYRQQLFALTGEAAPFPHGQQALARLGAAAGQEQAAVAALAEATGGSYFEADTLQELEEVYAASSKTRGLRPYVVELLEVYLRLGLRAEPETAADGRALRQRGSPARQS